MKEVFYDPESRYLYRTRARAVKEDREKYGARGAALECIKAAEEDLAFLHRRGCLRGWSGILHSLSLARLLLEEERE